MNKDDYKSAIEQIHASDELKEKTLEKMNKRKTNKLSYLKYLSACAIFILVFSVGFIELKKGEPIQGPEFNPNKTEKIATSKNDLPRFESMKELKEVLKENTYTKSRSNGMVFDSIAESADVNSEVVMNTKSEQKQEELSDYSKTSATTDKDHSTTNVQVENVDEADIIKTDGDYIYYIAYDKLFIVNAEELETVATIQIKEDGKKSFSPQELFINKDKLILLGNLYEYEENITREKTSTEDEATFKRREVEDMTYTEAVRINRSNTAVAMVYDIQNKEKPEFIRQVGLDGYYTNSRMIGDNVYFISNKNVYYYDNLKDEDLLPRVIEADGKSRYIECTDIAYFKGTENYSYMLVGGFNINNNDEMNVETFFGANSTEVYASEKNLYVTQIKYDNSYNKSNTAIYKFNLDNSNIVLTAKGEVEGYMNNQFSMDEYEGNLRVATTYVVETRTEENYDEETGIGSISYEEPLYSNRLYILDDNLKEIGKIDDLAKDEKIYSVRFMGKMGYIVTFEQVDPLFVIDLSDPTNPQIKGELKIPGYSSYLHPYDETHIIGIGYNTKSNGYGGITTDNMKMSMFDVSDVENPKEMFSIDIGKSYTSSELLYNHKVLFYKKSDNLIGFPVNYDGKNEISIYKIDLEKGFEDYFKITNERGYYGQRMIYIEDILYILSDKSIISYDLNSFEKIKELKLEVNINTETNEIIAY